MTTRLPELNNAGLARRGGVARLDASASTALPLELSRVAGDVAQRRLLGAYYTPTDVARVLVRWALKNDRTGRVLDPSFGGCSFLQVAADELAALGVDEPGRQVVGVDIDPECRSYVAGSAGLDPDNCWTGDFLGLSCSDLGGPFDAVVGNPPYVRHHWLKGASRAVAEAVVGARGEAFKLAGTASLWAYFVVHSLSFLKPGGRLALLVPDAVLQSDYAAPIRKLLAASFRRVTLVQVRERLFDDTDESVVLIAGDGFGVAGSLAVRSVDRAAEILGALTLDAGASERVTLSNGRRVSADAMAILDRLAATEAFVPLSDHLTFHIGVVTGANSHFVLSGDGRRQLRLAAAATSPIVSRTAWLEGLRFTAEDHARIAADGGRAYLVSPSPEHEKSQPVQRWIKRGEQAALHERHKCAERQPWYRLTDSRVPDAFVSAMRLGAPRLVLNPDKALCTNTLYAAFLVDPESKLLAALAVAFLTTPVALWSELHGRRYSRGVLKLDVGTLGRLPLPIVAAAAGAIDDLDALLRAGREDEARQLADRVVLQEGLGVSTETLATLESSLDELRTERLAALKRGERG